MRQKMKSIWWKKGSSNGNIPESWRKATPKDWPFDSFSRQKMDELQIAIITNTSTSAVYGQQIEELTDALRQCAQDGREMIIEKESVVNLVEDICRHETLAQTINLEA